MTALAIQPLTQPQPEDNCKRGCLWDEETITKPPTCFPSNLGISFIGAYPSPLIIEIDELAQLEDGWYDTDGEPGVAPTRDVLAYARKLAELIEFAGFPLPHVFPTVEGGISAEWSLGPIAANIEFHSTHEGATVASRDRRTGRFDYRENVLVNEEFLMHWLIDLSNRAR